MELSAIQKDILVTLISLYQKYSGPIKGEEIAEVIKRNPGTVRNQMQALKAIGLVDGIPGPRGGYTPTSQTYKELNLYHSDQFFNVNILRKGKLAEGIYATEVAFTTLCNPDLCHAQIKVQGSMKMFEIGDEVTIGPTPVNKLLIRGELFGKDEAANTLLITINEMISLPKQPIRYYMSAPLITVTPDTSLKVAIGICNTKHIHGIPVVNDDCLLGILTLSDIIRALDSSVTLDTPIETLMTREVVTAASDIRLYEVITTFKERKIGRLIVVEDKRPIGILTQSDIIRVFPSL